MSVVSASHVFSVYLLLIILSLFPSIFFGLARSFFYIARHIILSMVLFSFLSFILICAFTTPWCMANCGFSGLRGSTFAILLPYLWFITERPIFLKMSPPAVPFCHIFLFLAGGSYCSGIWFHYPPLFVLNFHHYIAQSCLELPIFLPRYYFPVRDLAVVVSAPHFSLILWYFPMYSFTELQYSPISSLSYCIRGA